MVTAYQMKSTVNDGLKSFLEDMSCNAMQFELLRFLGRHPKAKFSLYVIARAMGTGGTDLGDAILALIDRSILLEQTEDSGLTTYSLCGDSRSKGLIYLLANLDWSEASALKKLLPA
jgi:hypothetical protein